LDSFRDGNGFSSFLCCITPVEIKIFFYDCIKNSVIKLAKNGGVCAVAGRPSSPASSNPQASLAGVVSSGGGVGSTAGGKMWRDPSKQVDPLLKKKTKIFQNLTQ